MASPSEQLYKGFSWASFQKTPSLKSRLLFLLFAFIAIRAGSFIPLPGVDTTAWTTFWEQSPLAQLGGLF